MIVVDLVIVYLGEQSILVGNQFSMKYVTYKETVTSSSPQFENPMSMPLANPDGDIFFSDVLQSMWIRDLPVKSR